MNEPDLVYLEYGETPFDHMSHADLLLHAKRLYSACVSMHSTLSMLKATMDEQPYWTMGTGAQALGKGEQALEAIHSVFEGESIYRAYFRYADDLLFQSKDTLRLGFDWHVCTECEEMLANHKIKVGKPCIARGEPCKGVYRLLTWEDLKPVKDATA